MVYFDHQKGKYSSAIVNQAMEGQSKGVMMCSWDVTFRLQISQPVAEAHFYLISKAPGK